MSGKANEEGSSAIWRRAEQAVVEGDAVTLESLLEQHGEMLRTGPVQSSWWGGLAPDYSKGDARAIIAREHHFESWDQFADFASALKDEHSPIARFESAVDAIVVGDVATLERLLKADPALIGARTARRHHSTLLHYIGANGVEGFRQRTPKNAVQVAEMLLDAGADIKATADMYGGSDTLGLVATSIHPVTAGVQNELMAFLLDRGASVEDAKGGAAWSSIINACHANGRPGAAEFLARRAEMAMGAAMAAGIGTAAGVGTATGANTGAPASTLDLEAAAGVGRLDLVQRFFNEDGRLKGDATQKQMRDGFAWACEYGRTAVVDFLLQHGMDVRAKLNDGQTGLHWAAYGGHADTVGALLDYQAPVNQKDDTFGGTALGWALYAWGGGGPHAGSSRYYEVVRLLVAAGATVDEQWLDESKRGYPLARKIREDADMRALLKA